MYRENKSENRKAVRISSLESAARRAAASAVLNCPTVRVGREVGNKRSRQYRSAEAYRYFITSDVCAQKIGTV